MACPVTSVDSLVHSKLCLILNTYFIIQPHTIIYIVLFSPQENIIEQTAVNKVSKEFLYPYTIDV